MKLCAEADRKWRPSAVLGIVVVAESPSLESAEDCREGGRELAVGGASLLTLQK
ncbi:unnamed protein product [Protopolystoma xenopodis]|uniref:Uncharacterized protein n=1 Tax=Protopolystoma xenopodis TaxID=117903 RepID=A0A448WA52_9PLAT|nr:unnamed protein product [Protopolystoma xenopodis]